nr:6-phosphogluconolactonase [Haloechinothrix aidingensis]
MTESVATELVRSLAHTQAREGSASLAVTGGRTGIAVFERVSRHHLVREVDWSAVDFYWSDDRFVPRNDPERNELQVRRALLQYVPVETARVFPMPASDGVYGSDCAAAAASYADLLARKARTSGSLFDICLLGVGEDGHVASLFPGSAAAEEPLRYAVAVHGSPKPPSTRVTLTFPAIARAAETWLVTAGAAKAAAVASAVHKDPTDPVPAARVRGRVRTRWFLDDQAASAL